jgi:hypothetical protein
MLWGNIPLPHQNLNHNSSHASSSLITVPTWPDGSFLAQYNYRLAIEKKGSPTCAEVPASREGILVCGDVNGADCMNHDLAPDSWCLWECRTQRVNRNLRKYVYEMRSSHSTYCYGTVFWDATPHNTIGTSLVLSWRHKQQVSAQCWFLPHRICAVTSHKSVILICARILIFMDISIHICYHLKWYFIFNHSPSLLHVSAIHGHHHVTIHFAKNCYITFALHFNVNLSPPFH